MCGHDVGRLYASLSARRGRLELPPDGDKVLFGKLLGILLEVRLNAHGHVGVEACEGLIGVGTVLVVQPLDLGHVVSTWRLKYAHDAFQDVLAGDGGVRLC